MPAFSRFMNVARPAGVPVSVRSAATRSWAVWNMLCGALAAIVKLSPFAGMPSNSMLAPPKLMAVPG